jgi:hypothetical protein
MPDSTVHMALFKEGQIDHAAEAVAQLHAQGISHDDISVISGVPYSEKILGRPMSWSRVPRIALAGAGVGFVAAALLTFGTPALYPLVVGNQPVFPIPTSIVVIFELTMLGLLISTFLGVFVETISPSYGPKGYHPKISDGNIGVLYTCPEELDGNIHAALFALGAEFVQPEDN